MQHGVDFVTMNSCGMSKINSFGLACTENILWLATFTRFQPQTSASRSAGADIRPVNLHVCSTVRIAFESSGKKLANEHLFDVIQGVL